MTDLSLGVPASPPQRAIAAPGPTGSRPLSGLVALTGVVVALLWIAVIALVGQDRQNTRHQALQNLTNLSRAFAEHTAKTLEGADQAVRFVRSEYLLHHEALDISGYLRDRAIIDSDYHLLTVIGADGFVTHSSQPFKPVDLHDREHFRVHVQADDDRLFVSKPVLGKVSGKWSIQITRRITEPDGRFGGVVVVSMPPTYFTQFYKDVDLGPRGTIALVGTDGVVRARASQEGQQQGMSLQRTGLLQQMLERHHGTYESRSQVDGVTRLYAFRTLPGHDLMVVTGVAVDDALAEFHERRNITVGLAAAATAVLLLFATSLFRRIREQNRLVTALQASEIQANSANQLKSKFLASVSHELRTPLNGILGYAELIREGAEPDQCTEFGGIIFDSARHLHNLVDQILDLAKIESGRMVAHLEPTPLLPLLQETHLLHWVHAQSKGLTLKLVIDPGCPEQLCTDRTRLLQVLANVVSNAIKFTDHGGVVLIASREGNRLSISVRDTGIGIAAERLDKLFVRFLGAAEDFIHPNQGAGLGLPLARELTELLGGELRVVSRLGAGTEVRILLPVSLPSPASPEFRHDAAR
jgi:signal transduction histidine kinase